MLTRSDVARRLGVSTATIRNYAQQFGDHLSPGASPRPGQPRRFIEDDLRVMARVKRLLADGLTYEQVGERLAAGIHLLEEAKLPAPLEPEPEPAKTALVPMASVRLIVQLYMEQADQLRQEGDEALRKADEAFERVAELGGAAGGAAAGVQIVA